MALTFDQLVVALTPAQMQQQLLNSLQGVQPVVQQGANSGPIVGTGTITATGPAIGAAAVEVQILTPGQLGVGTFWYSLNGGQTWSVPATIPSSGIYQIPQINVTLTFANGLSTPQGGSFQTGELYVFSTTVPTFPVTNWSAASAPIGFVKMERDALSSLSNLVAQIAAGGLVSSWITPPAAGAPPSGWLDLLAQYVYNVPNGTGGSGRIQPTYTQGFVTLACSQAAGPYTIQLGQTIVQSASGLNFYVIGLPNGATLASGGTLVVQVQAQLPGAAYNAVNATGQGLNSITTMVTPLSGVVVTNPLLTNPPVTHVGAGGGTVTCTGTPTVPLQIIVEITLAGAPGVGQFVYSTSGGQPGSFSAAQAIPSTPLSIGSGMSLNFSGTFGYGDSYSASTNWITQNGSDAETNYSLATRCQAQWSSLAPGGPTAIYVSWAKAASAEVAQAFVFPDPTIAGQVDIVLANSQAGPVSAAALALVQAYISARVPEAVVASVSNVSQLAIPLTGTAFVPSAQVAAAQAALAAALFAKQVAIGAGGTVYYEQIEAVFQNALGAGYGEGFLMAGAQLDIALTQFQSALFGTSGITWTPT